MYTWQSQATFLIQPTIASVIINPIVCVCTKSALETNYPHVWITVAREHGDWPLAVSVASWLAAIEGFNWHLGPHVLAVIRTRGVAAIGNIISIALYGWKFGTVESGRISGTDRRSGVAATRRYAVDILEWVICRLGFIRSTKYKSSEWHTMRHYMPSV